MIVALFSAGAIAIALLQTTWFAHVFLVPALLVALVLYVDVVPASVAALFMGLTLDVLGIHAFGLSSAVVALFLVGAAELVRLSSRWAQKHPGQLLAVFVDVGVLLAMAAAGFPSGFVGTFFALLGHTALAFMLIPLFHAAGGRYRESQRELGLL